MSLKVCILASGSSGNSIYVESARARILIDAGLSGKEIGRRLETIGVNLAGIRAVCVTHEHDDHTAALGILHRRFGIPLYANAGTVQAIEQGDKLRDAKWTLFTTGSAFPIGDLRLEPFSVPHDSYDPVGFVVSSGDDRAGIVTDMGMATGLVRERLKGCRILVIETNHDEKMLQDADRPWVLKQRIAGRQGHFSNRQAAELIAEVAGPALTVKLQTGPVFRRLRP
jgi:phosphoribosyl 1,2-cyclic phosphodiesterase